MISKILSWLGLAACVILIISCFLPWTYHADVDKIFTAFFSEKDNYGKPGKFLIFFAITIFTFMIVPKVWAKRTNLFLSAFTLAYGFKTYILFTSCYNAYCPDKKAGIYIMLLSTVVMLIAAVFPTMKILEKKNTN